jgi:hypothetical protein
MQLSFERGDEIAREVRQLPAGHYNKIRLLHSRNDGKPLFVPLRGMQYLAIVDSEEVVFVDGQGPRVIEVSWQEFRSSKREDLRDPVNYTCIYYHEKGVRAMSRLQGEFLEGLELLRTRQPKTAAPATVTRIERD